MGLPSAPQGWDDGDGGHPRGAQGLAEGSPHGAPVWPRFPTPQRGGPRPGGGTPGAGSDPLAGMFVIWASASLPVSWSDEPAGSLPEGVSGSARELVSHVSEVVWDRGPLSSLRAQLPSGPTGLVRARPSSFEPRPCPSAGFPGLGHLGPLCSPCKHRAVHPGEPLPPAPRASLATSQHPLLVPLCPGILSLSESPSSPGQGPATWHRTQDFWVLSRMAGQRRGRQEPGASEGEGCCGGGLRVPAEGCSAPTSICLCSCQPPRRPSFPPPLSLGVQLPGPVLGCLKLLLLPDPLI